MDTFTTSCIKYHEFPRNIIHSIIPEEECQNLSSILNSRQTKEAYRLFNQDGNDLLTIWELSKDGNEYKKNQIIGFQALQKHVSRALESGNTDPWNRMVFISAPNSRRSLNVSKDMFTFICSYHQVSPGFLYHIFPFGEQDYPRGFHYISFTQDNTKNRGLQYPRLGRSGTEIKLSYSFKSAEKTMDKSAKKVTDQHQGFPWSLRQMSVYHSFDLGSGQSVWIMVKGNKTMETRLSKHTRAYNDMNTLEKRFLASLDIHLLLCRWISLENWSFYISDLEQAFQEATRRPTNTMLDHIALHQEDMAARSAFSKRPNLDESSPGSPVSPKSTFTWKSSRTNKSTYAAEIWEAFRRPHVRSSNATEKPDTAGLSPITVASNTVNGPNLPPQIHPPQIRPPQYLSGGKASQDDLFSLRDLQYVQKLAEKGQEALLVVSLNQKVLSSIRGYYHDVLTTSGQVPAGLQSKEIPEFSNDIKGLEENLILIITRLKNLLELIKDRQEMMFTILQYGTIETSKELNKQAQITAENTVALTDEMALVAEKTLDDTISMKIITIVTLFFLPGTFVSTIMSTGIIQYTEEDDGSTKMFAPQPALELYFVITIPLMVVTFLAWGIFRIWERRRLRLRRSNRRLTV